eukprot:4593708-Pleurochrysis_carterae.AAC.6
MYTSEKPKDKYAIIGWSTGWRSNSGSEGASSPHTIESTAVGICCINAAKFLTMVDAVCVQMGCRRRERSPRA